VVEILEGEEPKVRELWENGWVEVLKGGIAIGVREWEEIEMVAQSIEG